MTDPSHASVATTSAHAPLSLEPDDVVVIDEAELPSTVRETTSDDTPLPHAVIPVPQSTRTLRRLSVAPPSRAAAPTPVTISDEPLPELEAYNPWEVAAADRALRQGLDPQQLREQSADVLHLGRQNGRMLWLLLGLCGTLVLGTYLNAYFILGMPAHGIPSTEQVGLYKHAEHSQEEVCTFAERVAGLMRQWKYQTIRTVPKRVLPFLDPTLRGQWQSEFLKDTNDVASYRERCLFEPVKTVYRGIRHETTHVVDVYYQEYHGRGEYEGLIKFDAIARRLKHLEIAEGPTSSENIYGLYVVRHIDVSERAYLTNAVLAAQPNPWDQGLNIKNRPKPKPKLQTQSDENAP